MNRRGNLSNPSPSNFTPKPLVLEQPSRITNASQKQAYVPPAWNVRDGADNHRQHQSRGLST